MKHCKELFIAVSLWSAVTQITSHAQTGYAKTNRLDSVVGEILKTSNAPGGLQVVTGCSEFEAKTLRVPDGSTEDSLNALSRSDKALTWSKGTGGSYFATIQYISDVSLLGSIELPEQHLEAKTLSLATDLLLNNPSVSTEIARLGFRQSSDEFGFSTIRQHDHVINLPAGTLADDLMLLAASFGRAVWRLDERVCDGTRTFRIEWILR